MATRNPSSKTAKEMAEEETRRRQKRAQEIADNIRRERRGK